MTPAVVVWTALPNGFVGEAGARRARISVYASLRLQSSADLAGWRALLAQGSVSFTVQVGDLAVPANIVSPSPDGALWDALFPPTCRVVPHQPDDFSGQNDIRTFRAASLLADIRDVYRDVIGTHPYELPPPGRVQEFLQAAFAPAPPTSLDPGPGATMFEAGSGPEDSRLDDEEGPVPGSDDATANLFPDPGSPAERLAELVRFHRRTADGLASAGSVVIPSPRPAPMDFHQALAALGQFPWLLRRLGLVVDLEVAASSIPQTPPVPGGVGEMQLQVIPHFGPPAPLASFSPLTAFICNGDRVFAAQPTSPASHPTTGGLVNLALPGAHDLIQLDVDGAALKIANLGAHPPGQAGGLPSLRTSGVSIAKLGHARDLHARFAASQVQNTKLGKLHTTDDPDPPPDPTPDPMVVLYAEDLTRGYRVDVLDVDQFPTAWRSLHGRVGTYTFAGHDGGPLVVSVADEGMAQPSAYRAVRDDAAALYIHESLFHWQGWSLSAPRPGRTVGEAGPTSVTNLALPDGFQLEVEVTTAPGTLPRLRFGHRYRFRLRSVDVAGNSLSLTEADETMASLAAAGEALPVLPVEAAGFTYRRFEPVPSPVTVARERPTEGESQERLVIRSGALETAAACAARLTGLVHGARPENRVAYLADNERHLVPPKASEAMAEMSGMFDAAMGPGGDPQALFHLATKEKGSLEDSSVLDTTTGAAVPLALVEGIDAITGACVTRPAVEVVVDERTNITLHHEDQLLLPYLPDPLCAGAALGGLPGVRAGAFGAVTDGQFREDPSSLAALVASPDSLTTIGFDGQWPDLRPFRLRLAEPPDPSVPAGPPAWEPQARVLTVQLAKADHATVRLSSFVGPGLESHGTWRWVVDGGSADNGPDAASAQAGLVWALTPARELTLVHAVQQPLIAPGFRTVTTPARREPGRTFSLFGGTLGVDGKSTAKIDLLASWLDVNDDPLVGSGPTSATVVAHVFEVPIHLEDGPPASPTAENTAPVATYDLGTDTVTFIDVAPSAVPPIDPGPLLGPRSARPGHGPRRDPSDGLDAVAGLDPAIPDDGASPVQSAGRFGTIHVPGGDGGDGGDPEWSFLSRHEFGDTKYRLIRYHAVATSRFREYFPPEIANDPAKISVPGPEIEVIVPNAARPAAPTFVSAIPLFDWSRTTASDGTQVRIRRGGGVRVYVERPWYSSGAGELLGVVIAASNGGNDPPGEELRPHVTHWGRDPIWESGPLPGGPRPEHFSSFADQQCVSAGPLRIEDLDAPVAVVGYPVTYATERSQWYSDIRIDTGASYWPFVRLALARYQPHSLPATELSQVVLADFVQVAPDRTVTLAPSGSDQFVLTVEGPIYLSGAWDPGDPSITHDVIEVTVQERIPGTTDDLGWRPAADPAITVLVEGSYQIRSGASEAPNQGPPLWRGRLTLPPGRVPGELRALITEVQRLADDSLERRPAEPNPTDPNDPLPVKPGKPSPVSEEWNPGSTRVVFAETILL